MIKQVAIAFNLRFMLLLLLIELITVPLVAMSNPILRANLLTTLILGFIIAALALIIILRLLRQYLIINAEALFGVKVTLIINLWLVALIAGVLEMVMFAIQDVLFKLGANDFVVGFFSALGSVFCALVCYQLIIKFTKLAIIMQTPSDDYMIKFAWRDILYLSILFAMYELVVCPITGWWIPYSGWSRFGIAIVSAVVGAISGFMVMLFCLKLLKQKIYLQLVKVLIE